MESFKKMKKLLILLISIIAFTGYSQVAIPTGASVSNANVNTAIRGSITAGGTDTYSADYTGVSNITGFAYNVTFTNANTGSASFDLNTSGAVTIRKFESGSLVNLVAGDIAAGETKRLRYNGTYLVIEGGSNPDLSGYVESVTGDGMDNTDAQNPVMDLLSSRTLTSADDLDQSDNLHKVYLNSASPFNVTVDALTIESEVVLINIGSATVTLVNGSGVTMSGPTTILANESAIVLYKVSTAPIIRSSGTATLTDGHILVGNASNTATDVAMSGQATISNTGAVTLDNAAVIGKVLTGYTSGAGTVASTDNILQAIQKLNGNDALGIKVTGTSTLTGAATISNPIPSGFIVNHTFTTTASDQFGGNITGTITQRGTINENAYGTVFNQSVVAAANGQSLIGVQINPTLNSGAFSTVGSAIIPLLIGTKTTGLRLSANSVYSSGVLNLGSSSSTQIVMPAGGSTVELGSASSNTTHALVIVNNAQTTSGGGIVYLKQIIGNSTPNASSNFYGINSDGAITSNWTNAANFYGSSFRNSFAPTASASTFNIYHAAPTLNTTSTFSGDYGFAYYNPTETNVSLGNHYFIRSSSTTAKSGFGTSAPNSIVHVNGSWASAYVAKTANYTATISDYTIECTANTFQVTLPTAVGITGRVYYIVNSGAGTITIGTTSSQTFVNVTATPTTLTMATLGTTAVQSNGANWIKLSGL